ncbi:hypothetical protein SCD92_19415, partial [Gilvimarinus sp. SDUM040013]
TFKLDAWHSELPKALPANRLTATHAKNNLRPYRARTRAPEIPYICEKAAYGLPLDRMSQQPLAREANGERFFQSVGVSYLFCEKAVYGLPLDRMNQQPLSREANGERFFQSVGVLVFPGCGLDNNASYCD